MFSHLPPSKKRGIAMAQPTLTPYDTGERCEPKLWQPDRDSVLAAMRDAEGNDIGNVDFEDCDGETAVTVHVSKDADGVFTVHVIPFVDQDELRIETHFEDD
ncbi:MAG: hypothetical protein DI630_33055 [Gordonia sp. (in: high G+C Gram-positive bacteria)]|nr:MAG: hypothetical protein DI630_33055 [Gordonia sp. (in: high G+C Gram-positive bacteria)]